MTPAELAAWCAKEPPPLLLDVREAWEVGLCSLDQAVHIPMSEMTARITELDPEQPMVVYCHHGMRSLQVVTFLQQQGFVAVHNLTGGIDAWSRNVDSSVALY